MPARASRATVGRPGWPSIRLQTALRLRPRRALSSAEATQVLRTTESFGKKKPSPIQRIPTLIARAFPVLIAPRQDNSWRPRARGFGPTSATQPHSQGGLSRREDQTPSVVSPTARFRILASCGFLRIAETGKHVGEARTPELRRFDNEGQLGRS